MTDSTSIPFYQAGNSFYKEVRGVPPECKTPYEQWVYWQSVGAAFAREQENYDYDQHNLSTTPRG